MTRINTRQLAAVLIAAALLFVATPALGANTRLRDICRVKGLSEQTITGAGLVFGLAGTGDGAASLPTIRALARTMELMGIPIGEDVANQLKSAKNVALVMVTAKIPALGAQPGDKISCRVSAISAKSLHGGRLFTTPLLGQNLKRDRRVYALASGNIELESSDKGTLTAGKIHDGCQIQVEHIPNFSENDVITLVLHKHIAGFSVASEIVGKINGSLSFSADQNKSFIDDQGKLTEQDKSVGPDNVKLAHAISSSVIRVPISIAYLTTTDRAADPVKFLGEILDLPITALDIESRVVINKRANTIVISGELEIGSVVINRPNLTVKSGPNAADSFLAFDLEEHRRKAGRGARSKTHLQSLVDALNAVQVRTEDIIGIIEQIDASGNLYGKLIVIE